ncbi:MAG: FAD-binding oxidoreductase [bacterium]
MENRAVKDPYEKMSEIVGEGRVSRDELDLICYSYDFAPVPDELLKGYGMLGPDIIVKPKDTEAVSEILRYAFENRIPVTPRGAGTTALGGVLPMEGGIVIDLCDMDGIIELNEGDEYVRVEAGMEWRRLIDILDSRGFQVGANPTSGVSATVGGYISSGGSAGIGVPQYGVVGDQILSLKVVLPDGSAIDTNPWDSWLFVGSEGTLGIITEVTLKIFPKAERKFFMFGFEGLREGVSALRRMYEVKPYFLNFFDGGIVRLLNEMGAHLLNAEITLMIAIDGSPKELAEKERRVLEICRAGIKYPEGVAKMEWEERYKTSLSFKRLGPTFFGLELRLPIRCLEGAIRDLKALLAGEQWGIKSLSGDNESTCIIIYILSDEREKTSFFRKFSFARRIAKLGYKNHGYVYGIGVHNSTYMPQIHGSALRAMRRIKRQLDPRNILNPSKTVQVRIPPFIVNASMAMMEMAPGLVNFGLSVINYLPIRLIRLALRMMGGKFR